jgi:hypothetical protein
VPLIGKGELAGRDPAAQMNGGLRRAEIAAVGERHQDMALGGRFELGIAAGQRAKVARPMRIVLDVAQDLQEGARRQARLERRFQRIQIGRCGLARGALEQWLALRADFQARVGGEGAVHRIGEFGELRFELVHEVHGIVGEPHFAAVRGDLWGTFLPGYELRPVVGIAFGAFHVEIAGFQFGRQAREDADFQVPAIEHECAVAVGAAHEDQALPGFTGEIQADVGGQVVHLARFVGEYEGEGGREAGVLSRRMDRQRAGQAEERGAMAAIEAPQQGQVIVVVVARNRRTLVAQARYAAVVAQQTPHTLAQSSVGGVRELAGAAVVTRAAAISAVAVLFNLFSGLQDLIQYGEQRLRAAPLAIADEAERFLRPVVQARHALEEHFNEVVARGDALLLNETQQKRVAFGRGKIAQLVHRESLSFGREVPDFGRRDVGQRPVDIAERQQPVQSIVEGLKVREGGALGQGLEPLPGGRTRRSFRHEHLQALAHVRRQTAQHGAEEIAIHLGAHALYEAIQRAEGRQFIVLFGQFIQRDVNQVGRIDHDLRGLLHGGAGAGLAGFVVRR